MLNKEQKIRMLKVMITIRKFEQSIKNLYKEGFVEGAIHCYTGEEAIAAGVCGALEKSDYIFSTHRGHGHAIAKGCDLKKIFAEIMGREAGLCRGLGGSMHLFDAGNGLMGGNGIVGGGLPLSLGTAYSARYRGNNRITACFFSEGASNQGTFHEALNMASLWKLPLLFVCENNLFAATTPSFKTLSNPDISARAIGYGMPGVVADGNDVIDVYTKTCTAVETARTGNGPTLIECKTYRVEGHCMVLKDLPQFRDPEVVSDWAERDPINIFIDRLSHDTDFYSEDPEGSVKIENIRKMIEDQTEKEFEEAIDFAKSSPLPDPARFKKTVHARYQS